MPIVALLDELIISIHALHEESDHAALRTPFGFVVISIHALHEESDLQPLHIYLKFAIFQSTLSMRRATRWLGGLQFADDISIHALHEESDAKLPVAALVPEISIHALHEESDPAQIPHDTPKHNHFNPRSP